MSVIPLDQITQTPSQNQITQSLKLMAMWREDLAGWEAVAVLELAGRSWSSTAGARAGRVGSGLGASGLRAGRWDPASRCQDLRSAAGVGRRRVGTLGSGGGLRGERARTGVRSERGRGVGNDSFFLFLFFSL
jgi:hypothetical protein